MATTVASSHYHTSSQCTWDWDEPMCLIENTDEMGLKVNQKTLARLKQVTVPVVSVAVVGLYRTGKSYIMNILAGKRTSSTGELHEYRVTGHFQTG